MERLKQRKDWIEEKRGREVEWEWRGNGVKRGSTRGEMGKMPREVGQDMEWKCGKWREGLILSGPYKDKENPVLAMTTQTFYKCFKFQARTHQLFDPT